MKTRSESDEADTEADDFGGNTSGAMIIAKDKTGGINTKTKGGMRQTRMVKGKNEDAEKNNQSGNSAKNIQEIKTAGRTQEKGTSKASSVKADTQLSEPDRQRKLRITKSDTRAQAVALLLRVLNRSMVSHASVNTAQEKSSHASDVLSPQNFEETKNAVLLLYKGSPGAIKRDLGPEVCRWIELLKSTEKEKGMKTSSKYSEPSGKNQYGHSEVLPMGMASRSKRRRIGSNQSLANTGQDNGETTFANLSVPLRPNADSGKTAASSTPFSNALESYIEGFASSIDLMISNRGET